LNYYFFFVDTNITENPDDKKVNESFMPSFMRFISEADKPDDKAANGEETVIDPLVEPKDAPDDIKKMIKENQDAVDKERQDIIKYSVEYLSHYMKTFAGETEASKINEKAVQIVYLPEGSDP
jgi:hypothetical protein